MTTDQVASAEFAVSETSRQKYNKVICAIQTAKKLLAELSVDDEIAAYLMYPEANGHLQQAIEYLVYARPSSLCRSCDGTGVANDSTCFPCKGHGWLPAGVTKANGTGRQ